MEVVTEVDTEKAVQEYNMIKPVAREIGTDLYGRPYEVSNPMKRGEFIIKGEDHFKKVVVEIHADEVLDVFIHPVEGSLEPTMNIAVKASTLIDIIKRRNNMIKQQPDDGAIQVGDGTNQGSVEQVIVMTEDDIFGR